MLTHNFDNPHVSQVFSTAVYNLVFGELLQAKRELKDQNDKIGEFNIDLDEYFTTYVAKTYYKTASMISLGCRGLGLIFNLDIDNQRRLFNFGAHLGIAFQVHDDILDFTQDEAVLGKPAFNDVKEGIITAPLVFAHLEYKNRQLKKEQEDLGMMISTKFHDADMDYAKELLFNSNGIVAADKLSYDHISAGVEDLQKMQHPDGNSILDFDETHTRALMGLALKVKTRKY